jgi:hypothetical protein
VAIVEDADASVGQIVDALNRHGRTDNTLVVFMSDIGGEWLSRNAPFFHRKDSLWEGGIHVPAIFRRPSVLPAGATSDQVGITMDVTATILAATATPVPPETRLDGESEFLFNLRDDPGERNDLATRQHARVREMRALSDAWVKDVDAEAKALASPPAKGPAGPPKL